MQELIQSGQLDSRVSLLMRDGIADEASIQLMMRSRAGRQKLEDWMDRYSTPQQFCIPRYRGGSQDKEMDIDLRAINRDARITVVLIMACLSAFMYDWRLGIAGILLWLAWGMV
ncbi:MAG TPA: hypothetical protein PLN94_11475 [Thiolinea sp.]|nr:hypothetical protein [Thiolinea sp.]